MAGCPFLSAESPTEGASLPSEAPLSTDVDPAPAISSAPEEAVSSPCPEGDTADAGGYSARPEPEAPPSSKASAEGKGTDIAKDVASTRDNAVFFFEKRMENS